MAARMRSPALLALSLLLAACPRSITTTGGFASEAGKLLDAAETEGAVAAGIVLDAVTGESLWARRPATTLLPASTMKVVTTIAEAAERQASTLQQVNTAVSSIDLVTQQNAAMVEEATAAASSLAGEADTLAREVSQFRLGDSPAPRPSRPAADAGAGAATDHLQAWAA